MNTTASATYVKSSIKPFPTPANRKHYPGTSGYSLTDPGVQKYRTGFFKTARFALDIFSFFLVSIFFERHKTFKAMGTG
jgi:hypothetical protein